MVSVAHAYFIQGLYFLATLITGSWVYSFFSRRGNSLRLLQVLPPQLTFLCKRDLAKKYEIVDCQHIPREVTLSKVFQSGG